MTLFKHSSPGSNPGGIDRTYGSDWDLLVDYVSKSRTVSSSPYTVVEADRLLLVDTSSGSITINLPVASTVKGKVYIIIKTASNNTVTINRAGSDTINGATSYTLSNQYETLFISNNESTAWFIVNDFKTFLRTNVDNDLGDHFLDFGDITTPATPSSGKGRLFFDSSDSKLKIKKSTGTTVDLEATGAGAGDSTCQIPTAETQAAYQTAIDNAGENGKVRFKGSQTVTINTPIRVSGNVNNDGIILDGQRIELKIGNSWVGTGIICVDVSSGTQTNRIVIENFVLNCWSADETKTCHGITNFDEFEAFDNSACKFWLIRDNMITNIRAGKSGIALWHLENSSVIEHNHIDSVASDTAGAGLTGRAIQIWNAENNAGNTRILNNICGAHGMDAIDGLILIDIFLDGGAPNNTPNALNRYTIAGNHLFGGNTPNGKAIFIHSDYDGGVWINRNFWIYGNSCEDNRTCIEFEGSTGTDNVSGLKGIMMWGNSLEHKQNTASTAIKIGTNVQANIWGNIIHVRPQGSTVATIINITSTMENWFHHNQVSDTNTDGVRTFLTGSGSGNLKAWKNMGFKTEAHVTITESVSSTGIHSFSIPHGLDITPSAEDVSLTIQDSTANATLRYSTLTLTNVTSTHINGQFHVSVSAAISVTIIAKVDARGIPQVTITG